MGSNGRIPRRREIWWVDFSPGQARELIERHPALILSSDALHDSGREMVIVVPCSSTKRGFPTHVELKPQHTRMKKTTYAMCEQVRSISLQRPESCIGYLDSDDDLRAIEDRIAALMELPTDQDE